MLYGGEIFKNEEYKEEALRKRGPKFTNVHSDIITGVNDY
jgi:hypothetical protein